MKFDFYFLVFVNVLLVFFPQCAAWSNSLIIPLLEKYSGQASPSKRFQNACSVMAGNALAV